MHNKVIACIDDYQYAESVCGYAAGSAQRLDAPLSLKRARISLMVLR